MIQFRYFRSAEAEQFTFYRIPKLLFTSDVFKPLSCEAKVLYGLMLDRVSLSAKNDWKDEEDRVYIIYAVSDICEQLGCGRQKAFRLLAELDMDTGIGLIERKRRGLGKENLIYVKSFVIEDEQDQKNIEGMGTISDGNISGSEDSEETAGPENADLSNTAKENPQKYENHTSGSMSMEMGDISTYGEENPTFQKYENHTSRSMKSDMGSTGPQKYENHTSGSTEIILPEVRKSYPNKTNNNKTNKSDNEILSIHPISPSAESIEGDMDTMGSDSQAYYNSVVEELRDQTGYESLLCDHRYDTEQVNQILVIMADLLTSGKKSIMISGERVPIWKIQKRVKEIDLFQMQYVLECLEKNRSDVRNVKKYLIATLYNAPTTIRTYYQQAVNYDMANFGGTKEGEQYDH